MVKQAKPPKHPRPFKRKPLQTQFQPQPTTQRTSTKLTHATKSGGSSRPPTPSPATLGTPRPISSAPSFSLPRSHSVFLPPPKPYTNYHLKPSLSPKSSKMNRTPPGLPMFKVRASPSSNKTSFHHTPLPASKKTTLHSPRHGSRLSLSDLALPGSSNASVSSSESSPLLPPRRPFATTPTPAEGNTFAACGPEAELIKTFLRLRPSDSKEEAVDHHGYVEVLNDTEVRMNPPTNTNHQPRTKLPSRYKFTKVYGQEATQAEVFEETCLPLLAPILRQENYNALLFAYGVSNSGKTHSILGNSLPGQAGILPRALAIVFRSIETYVQDSGEAAQYRPVGFQDVEKIDPAGLGTDLHDVVDSHDHVKQLAAIQDMDAHLAQFAQRLSLKLDQAGTDELTLSDISEIDSHVISLPEGMDYTVWLSCSEVYTEKIYDLLAEPKGTLTPIQTAIDPKRQPLSLKTDPTTGHKYVHGLKEIRVRTLEEALIVLRAGLRQRKVYSTLVNKSSSRSHCVFTIKILKTPQFGGSAQEDAAKGKTSVSRLSIVDLAGSERVRNTNSTGQRLKEAGNINHSLMVLGQCMEVLRWNQLHRSKPPRLVPFRHTKLTQLFQSTLEGQAINSQVAMIVNANSFGSGFEETANVMKFSSVAMEVSTPRSLNSREDSSVIQKASAISTKASFDSHVPSSSDLADEPIETKQHSQENECLVSLLQDQVEEYRVKWLETQTRCNNIEAKARDEAAAEMRAWINELFNSDRHKATLESMGMDVDTTPTCTLAEHSSQAEVIERLRSKVDLNEQDIELLEGALSESQEKIQALQKALQESEQRNANWQLWLASAPFQHPIQNVSRSPEPSMTMNMVCPPPAKEANVGSSPAPCPTDATPLGNIVPLCSDKARLSMSSRQSTELGPLLKPGETKTMLQDNLVEVEERAVEEAAWEEDLADDADLAMNLDEYPIADEPPEDEHPTADAQPAAEEHGQDAGSDTEVRGEERNTATEKSETMPTQEAAIAAEVRDSVHRSHSRSPVMSDHPSAAATIMSRTPDAQQSSTTQKQLQAERHAPDAMVNTLDMPSNMESIMKNTPPASKIRSLPVVTVEIPFRPPRASQTPTKENGAQDTVVGPRSLIQHPSELVAPCIQSPEAERRPMKKMRQSSEMSTGIYRAESESDEDEDEESSFRAVKRTPRRLRLDSEDESEAQMGLTTLKKRISQGPSRVFELEESSNLSPTPPFMKDNFSVSAQDQDLHDPEMEITIKSEMVDLTWSDDEVKWEEQSALLRWPVKVERPSDREERHSLDLNLVSSLLEEQRRHAVLSRMENKESGLPFSDHRTPEKPRRSSASHYEIDYPSESLAEISPVKALYPRLDWLSPQSSPMRRRSDHLSFTRTGGTLDSQVELVAVKDQHPDDMVSDEEHFYDAQDVSSSALIATEARRIEDNDDIELNSVVVRSMEAKEATEEITEEAGTLTAIRVMEASTQVNPDKKRKRKLRSKKAVFEEEMDENVGMSPPPVPGATLRNRKKATVRKSGSGRA